MHSRFLFAAALCGLALLPVRARADALPPPPPPKDVKFTVEVDEKAKAPKLIVPHTMTFVRVPRPRPGPGGAKENPAGKEPVALLEVDGDDAAPAEAPRNPNHLMIAGVALSLALGLGGLWLVRRPGWNAFRTFAVVAGAGGLVAVGTVVWANAPPPKPKTDPAALPVAAEGNLTLEFGGRDTIRLVLDKETYEKLKKEPKAPGGK